MFICVVTQVAGLTFHTEFLKRVSLFLFFSNLFFADGRWIFKGTDGCNVDRCVVKATTFAADEKARKKPLISIFAKLNVIGGSISDWSPGKSVNVTPSTCGSYVAIDYAKNQEAEFRGVFDRERLEGAWYHPLNEYSRLGETFPVLQIALSSSKTELRGSFTATTSADEAGIVHHQICCNCDRDDL